MCGWKKVFQNSMQNFAFREGPNNAHKLHAARIIADFAYINLKSWRFCLILFCCFFYCSCTIQIKNVCFRIYVQCSGQNSANLAKGQLNSEWIYEVIVSPKMQTKNYKNFCPAIQTRIVVLFLMIFWWCRQFFWLWSSFIW